MSQDQAAGTAREVDLLVVGGGVAGVTTAVEAAEAGLTVALVEREPSLGGRVARFYHYFPKLCPPSCGLEINYQRIRKNPRITVHTLAEVSELKGQEGDYTATVRVKPRYVKPDAMDYTEFAKECPVELDNPFDYDLSKRKALYYPHEHAFPAQWVVDERALGDQAFIDWARTAPDGGIDLDQKEETLAFKAKSVAWATGWVPYDPKKLDLLGYGSDPDVVTNVMFERLSAPNGPMHGELKAPSGREVKRVAFVQCAGSRDKDHLPFCSGVCCTASLKQASYVRDKLPEAQIHMFYIDVRTPGRLEDFYQDRQEDPQINLHRGKVAKVEKVEGGLAVTAENTLTGDLETVEVDLVVLATGMQPATALEKPPVEVELDENGFFVQQDEPTGIYGVGTNVRPLAVAETLQDATGAAMKAVLMARRS